MTRFRRTVIAVCLAMFVTTSAAVPATAGVGGSIQQIDPCRILGPILGDRC